MEETNTIKFALYLKAWDFKNGDKYYLRKTAQKIPPTEYISEMKGHLFCPECTAPLFRSPEEKDYSTNGRKAFYAHNRGVNSDCSLRVKQAEGKRYENEEEARKAVEDGELVVVQSFMRDKPISPKLYFGRITSSVNKGNTSKNIRQTFLRYPGGNGYKDFCLKATDESSREHGIDDESKARIAIVYGIVTKSGIGLCISNLGWGEIGLLPRKYESLLDDV
jgi:hypothetical protein